MGNEQKESPSFNDDFEKTKKAILDQVGEFDEIEIRKHYSVTKDNKIHFDYKHNEQKYKELAAVLENVLNILKVEDPDEIQALMFKLKQGENLIVNQEIKGFYDSFVSGLEQSYKSYLEKLRECLSCIKNNYLSNQNFLIDFFKGDKNSDTEIQESIYSENNDKEDFIQKVLKFHKFEEQIEFINKFCKAIDEGLKEKLCNKEELKKFYDDKHDKMAEVLDEKQKDQNLNFLMFLGSLVNFFTLRNGLMDKISDIFLKKNDIYITTLQNSNKTTHLDFLDSVSELNEFLQVNIHQRFIQKIENHHKFIFNS